MTNNKEYLFKNCTEKQSLPDIASETIQKDPMKSVKATTLRITVKSAAYHSYCLSPVPVNPTLYATTDKKTHSPYHNLTLTLSLAFLIAELI